LIWHFRRKGFPMAVLHPIVALRGRRRESQGSAPHRPPPIQRVRCRSVAFGTLGQQFIWRGVCQLASVKVRADPSPPWDSQYLADENDAGRRPVARDPRRCRNDRLGNQLAACPDRRPPHHRSAFRFAGASRLASAMPAPLHVDFDEATCPCARRPQSEDRRLGACYSRQGLPRTRRGLNALLTFHKPSSRKVS
jgi:hypothetical protein